MRPCLLLMATLAGCGPTGGLTASVLEAAPLMLDSTNDAANDLTIRVRYHDPNGSLGGGTAEIVDCRAATDPVVTRLQLPEIASAEAVDRSVPIEGELDLLIADVGKLPSTGVAPPCRPLGVAEVTAGSPVFCVFLVDARGLRSSGDCTLPISIR